MIKNHLFAAYASCTLLWCSMATDLAAQELSQTGKQLTFRKAEIPIEGEYIDAVFYTDSLSQELRPKIIIRKESVDFMTRAGALQHRVVTRTGRYATIAVNGKFIGFYHPRRFVVYKDTGELLWQDAPPEEGSEDVPERGYRISSQGNVCILLRRKGSIIFHNQHGAVLAEHAITDGMSRTLEGEWSSDGQYFVVSATITGMYRDNRLFLFDARGAKLWEKSMDNRWAVEREFSPQLRWLLLMYWDFDVRKSGIAILAVQDGSIAHDLSQIDLFNPAISSDGKYFLARGSYVKGQPGQKAALFDIQTGIKRFEIFLPKRILDYVIFSDERVIYVLHDSEIVKLDMSGAVISNFAFERQEGSEDILRIHRGSTADRVLIRTSKSLLYMNVSE
ncbi:hypothetical protein L6R21_03350 [bacterium]|nr:hypothetical protein [bacterium]